MIAATKLPQGTTAWFDMVGTLMTDFASQANLPSDLTVSFVECYSDGEEIADGLMQGIRFDIQSGKPSYRTGAKREETADIMVEVTAAVARKLNTLRSADPAYPAAQAAAIAAGEMKVDGDPLRLGAWLDAVHDPIVDRTI